MNTLATREQSEAIRKQMRSIRSDLPYAMDDARENLQQLAEWRYYVRQLPLASIAAAFAIGYLVVPYRKPKRVKQESESRGLLQRFQPKCEPVEKKEPEQASFSGGLMGAAAAMALRAGVSLAIRQLGQSLLGPRSSRRDSGEFRSKGDTKP